MDLREEVMARLHPLLRELDFQYFGEWGSKTEYRSEDGIYKVGIRYDYKGQAASVSLYRLSDVASFDMAWVDPASAEEVMDMMRKHDYAPAIALHRLRMLNLLLD